MICPQIYLSYFLDLIRDYSDEFSLSCLSEHVVFKFAFHFLRYKTH